ncbi:hypothetical protein IC582_016260 [Cucumis melo]
MAFKIPGCNIHDSTIDSRIKLMKKMFHALAEMRGLMCSGFGWNDEKNVLSQRKKSSMIGSSHQATKDLLNKSFVHYDELSYVFGKDRATGGRAESFADVGSNDPAEYDAFSADAAPDMDFSPMYTKGLNMSPDDLMGTMYSKGLNMSPDDLMGTMYSKRLNMSPDDLMGTTIARVNERRNVSSGSKRKRVGHATDSGDIVRTAIEYGNEQLNRIAEWPVLLRQDVSQTRQEVVRQLEAILELTLMDRCLLMRILIRNVNDMKAFLDVPDNMKYPYCSIILQENR